MFQTGKLRGATAQRTLDGLHPGREHDPFEGWIRRARPGSSFTSSSISDPRHNTLPGGNIRRGLWIRAG